MNRREFIQRSSLLASAGLIARPSLFAETPAPAATPPTGTVPVKTPAGVLPAAITKFTPLRRDTGYFTGRGGTIGWLCNKDAVVAVDTQFKDTAAVFISGLPGRDDRMFNAVINTHHHRDHTGGNPIFKPVAHTIVAHVNVPKLMLESEKEGSREGLVYPDQTFPDVFRRVMGGLSGEIVTAQYFGPAHTGGDAVISFEKANVIHLGDLVFNRLYPVTDRPGGCHLQTWVVKREEVVKTYPKDAIYLFGHGNPKFGVTGGHADILAARDFLSALLDHTQKAIAAGKSKEEIVALENFPGFEDLHAPLPNRLQGNLSVAYDELTEKKG